MIADLARYAGINHPGQISRDSERNEGLARFAGISARDYRGDFYCPAQQESDTSATTLGWTGGIGHLVPGIWHLASDP